MIDRYKHGPIDHIWSDKNKLDLWQKTELAVLSARLSMGLIDAQVYADVVRRLNENPISVAWWLKRDGEIGHDLNAFLEERLQYLPSELQKHFHAGMTSYDTEESAFVTMLDESCAVLEAYLPSIESALIDLVRRYRFTPMMARTHGQEAQVQSFGKRCLCWLQSLRVAQDFFSWAQNALGSSKLSGAVGNYGGIDPAVEKKALEALGFEPFYGATQILPRILYLPLASAIRGLILVFNQIALDIRLGARSGRPIYQEPFAKVQKGSSAMPHKKNPVSTEKVGGMARLGQGFSSMIDDNVVTWEERDISQSSVERVAWPDLFQTAVHAAKTTLKVLEGLAVYPDNMLLEIIDSRGCYASEQAKEFLKQKGLAAEDAYRIVQLAAFNAFEPSKWQLVLRENPCNSFDQADQLFFKLRSEWGVALPKTSIQHIISSKELRPSSQLRASAEDVVRWNNLLGQIFSLENWNEWDRLFVPSYHLRNESKLYQEILGE